MPNFTIDLNGLTFVLENNKVDVYSESQRVGTYSTLDADGLPTVFTKRQLEESAMWYAHEYNVI